MVSILLTVLKIIGIALCTILGLVLFILLLVLFVPVRYSGRGSYLEENPSVALRATWLLHLISVRGEYQREQALHIHLKLLGITIYDNLKIRDKKTKNKKVKSTKNKKEMPAGEIQAASSETSETADSAKNDICAKEEWTESSAATDMDADTELDFPDEPLDNAKKRVGIVQKIKNFFINFVSFFKNIKFTFDKVCDTIVKIKDNIRYYLKVLQLDSTKRAFASCQTQLMRILKKISPRKFRVNLHLGFEDPAVMGEVLAVWGMLYPIHQGAIDIQPEFEQSVLEGNFFFQGRVSVVVFVKSACILFFDRDVKHLIKHLKRGGA